MSSALETESATASKLSVAEDLGACGAGIEFVRNELLHGHIATLSGCLSHACGQCDHVTMWQFAHKIPQLVRANRLNWGKNFGNVRLFYESNAQNANRFS